ncbi:unnamed protein product [Clavelina lepadiformis]|uniref:GOST seven transmembrane domain-containing protein n=1 Tax=Clavelina lepadiformis TaxID=159417 RepID=A0ABP0F6Z1_CLALP
MLRLYQLLLFSLSIKCSFQSAYMRAPEQGIFKFNLNPDTPYNEVSKILYNDSAIRISVNALLPGCKDNKTATLRWLIRGVKCKGDYALIAKEMFTSPPSPIRGQGGIYLSNGYYDTESLQWVGGEVITCKSSAKLKVFNNWTTINVPTESTTNSPTTTTLPTVPKPQSRKRREDSDPGIAEPENTEVETKPDKPSEIKTKKSAITTPLLAEYVLIVAIGDGVSDVDFEVTVKMESPVGYLSAHEYPLLTFYMVMCIVYVFYAVAWLVLAACNYRDLLRVQFWVGGVILLGMIEKAVHYSEYMTVNTTGESLMGIEKLAEVVSALKRAVARMLVIIVSLGFGIVKPRLGPMLHRVIGIGTLYFILAVLESMMRIDAYFHPSTTEAWMFMYIPLAIVDSIICWWIFMSLMQTMKTLRLRRNIIKLSLYRHFANAIVFCVVVSIGLMLWSIHVRNQECNSDFSNSWLETACWPMLFSIILLVIMVLWRPNANNQRYAYSPMIDGNDSDDEEMEEPMLGSGATESMKMRGTTKILSKPDVDRTEEDLKWIEENIPQTVADAALPAFMDSDEEVMTTKYEMSKME